MLSVTQQWLGVSSMLSGMVLNQLEKLQFLSLVDDQKIIHVVLP